MSYLDIHNIRNLNILLLFYFLPEKRQKFDHGEDPLDPESQQGQGFNPFQHQDFGGFGEGFNFKFHFN